MNTAAQHSTNCDGYFFPRRKHYNKNIKFISGQFLHYSRVCGCVYLCTMLLFTFCGLSVVLAVAMWMYRMYLKKKPNFMNDGVVVVVA